MTTVRLPDTSTYTTTELVSCLVAPHQPVPTDQKVDRQQGSSQQINTAGHSTPLTITSVQLNGTGRPDLVHRISVRDEEAAGHRLARSLLATTNPGGKALILSVARRPRQSHHNIDAFVEYRSRYRSASRFHQRQPTQ